MTEIDGAAAFKDGCVSKRKKVVSDLPPEVVARLDGLFSREALEEALQGVSPDEITRPGGLITTLAGRVVQAALRAELTEHLGHPPGGEPAQGNIRNGGTPKTLHTELGPVQIETPRDREGTFEPRLVKKRQTRLAGLDERILDLYAGGMSVRDISGHLAELYGVEISRDTISRVTGAVLEDIAAWRSRPLDAVYPIVYFDAMRVKVREDRSVQNRACYLALGITLEGDREPLGIWWQGQEGAKFWMGVLSDLQQRGVADVLICCVDGLTGFPEAIEAVYPQAWVQTCVVHEVRQSIRYVNYKDRKPVARDLRSVYTAANAEQALAALEAFDERWGAQYPMIARMWRRDWEYITPFLSLPQPLRKVVYTTNTIEAMHRQVRKAIKTRGAFPDEQAATKLIYLAILRAETKWRHVQSWTPALAALKIHFGDRLPD
jgi:putative transposase